MDFIIKSCISISGDRKLKMFTFQRALFNMAGYDWFEGGLVSHLPKVIKFIYPNAILIGTAVCSWFTLITSIKKNPENDMEYLRMINGFAMLMVMFSGSAKISFLSLNKAKLIHLVNTCETSGIDVTPFVKQSIKNAISYGLLIISNAVTWSAYYLIGQRDAPFDTDYPWNSEKQPLQNVTCCGYAGIIHILTDTMFTMSVTVICEHLHRLKKSLSKIGRNDQSEIKNIIRQHVKISKLSDMVIETYSKLFVAQCIYCVMHACILIFSSLKVNDVIAFGMSSLPLLGAAYAQLFMYCYYGQSLTSEFNDLTDASYNNQWYKCGVEERKSLILFMEVCKKPVCLKPFGSIKASLANFQQSIQESVSYFLILKTLTSDDEQY